jgi:hypothetical protein
VGVRFFGRGRRRRPVAGGGQDPPPSCPLCGCVWQEHVPDVKGRAGEPGQISVCRHCGALLVTLSPGSFRPATPAEQFGIALGPYGEEWHAIRRCARHARILRTYGVDLSPEELR